MLTDLVGQWGYLAVGVGAFVEGEAVLLTAGALARAGLLSLPTVVLVAAAGSIAWGQTWFHVGSASGKTLLRRRPAWRGRAASVERWLSRADLWILLCGRFVVGMGTVLPAMVGASGFSRRRFLVLDSIGALLWATVFSCTGFGVAAGVRRLAGQGVGWPLLAAAGVATAVLVAIATRLWTAFAARRGGGDVAPASAKQVIITGDDFGLALPVNVAIERAFRHGVLTTTSLMVGEPATTDAVARARENPGLRVGLHVAVCDGRPTLPPSEIPALVDAHGMLRHPVLAMIRLALFAWQPGLRRQLEAEMRAQFQAFAATGLTLDHVNGHNNMQLHPLVLTQLIKLAREHGVTAMRLPYEPLLASWRAARGGLLWRLAVWLVMRPWGAVVKRRLLREGFVVNDYLFGVVDCGAMDQRLLKGIIENLPNGLSEIHCHPATHRFALPHYRREDELAALVDPSVREALARCGVESLAGFGGARER